MSEGVQGFRLSPQQRRWWRLDQAMPMAPARAVARVAGDVSAARLRAALEAAVARHESLRTTFHRRPGMRWPIQTVGAGAALVWRELSDADLAALDREEAGRRFDLEHGPVLAATHVTLGGGEGRLWLTLAGICGDARSLENLVAELAAELAGAAPEPPEVQYLDYSEWLNEQLGEGTEEALAEPADTAERRVVRGTLGADATLSLAARLGVSPRALLLAAWQTLLARLDDTGAVRVAVVCDGREIEEFRTGIGLFARPVEIAVAIAERESLALIARRAERALAEAAERGETAAESGATAGFSWHTVPALLEQLAEEIDRRDLSLHVESGERLALELCGVAAAGPRGDLEALLERLEIVLDALIADPEQEALAVPMLTAAEREQMLVAWNHTAAPAPAAPTLHELFALRAAADPAAIAVRDAAGELSYGELLERARVLARRLAAAGVARGDRVGLCLERSCELAVAMLGILEAGAAYVPLDPAYPARHRELLVEEARPVVVLDSAALAALPAPSLAAELVTVGADDLAYVLFTSGSTGRPKGVMVPHGAVVNYLAWCLGESGYGAAAFALSPVHSPLGFDFTITSLFGALLSGGTAVMLADEGGVGALARTLATGEVGLVKLTPAHLEVLGPTLAPGRGAATLVVGGEALFGESLARWRAAVPAGRVINEYGPTEAAVGCIVHELAAGPPLPGPVPIGRPITNTRVYLLDRRLRPVPAGAEAEICIGGRGLARGYLGRPGQTAERFVPDPMAAIHGERGARLYRSGDLARFRPDQELEYLGRNDVQLKIRGVRIEPGQVAAALTRHPDVREAAVIAREDVPGDRRLVAYLVAESSAPKVEMLREFLAGELPDFMLPHAFVTLARIPLTAHGKVDRRALPAPDTRRPDLDAVYEPPVSPVETTLAALVGEVLALERVGRHDNFFTLGGDSIRSVRFAALAQEQGLEFSVQELFQNPTIAGLAELLAARAPEAVPAGLTLTPTRPFELISSLERAQLPAGVEDAYPMTMVQQGMTYHMQLTRERPVPAYHNLSSWNLEAPFELEPFLQSVAVVVARHAYLRTSFDLDRFAEPMQLVHREIALPVEVVDLRALLPARRQAEIERFFRQENRRLFVLDRPPLWRIHVHRRTDKNFQFSLTEPHMISDGWSTTSTLSEMFSHYFALLKGRPIPPAPVLPFSFRDVVAMERASLRSPEAERYFRRVVEGGTAFELPRWPRPAPGGRRAHDRKPFIAFSPEQVAGLDELARLAGVPIKSVLLAAHLKFLRLRSGHDNVITGLVCNSRPEQPGGDQVRGLFLNTLPFRVPSTAGSWIDLAKATFEAEAEQLPFRHFPGPEVQRRWARAPLFEAAFTYLHFHSLKTLAGSGDFRSLPGRKDPSVSHFTLFAVFDISVAKGALTLFLEHDDTQIRAEQIRLWYGDYQRILAAMAADPHASEHGVWISAAERHQVVVERNDTAVAPVSGTLAELIVAQTRATPAATALVARGARLSYGELAARVHRLARHLHRAGVGPEVVVALGLERGVELVVAILAVLEAGGAWVYLDPTHPRERLAAILENTGARVLVVRAAPRAGWAPPGLRVLALAQEEAAIAAEPATAPPLLAGAGNLAHLINTSGSTGKPKAVAIEHRSVVALVAWARGAFDPAELGAVLAATSFGFDLSIFELLVPLALGGTVILADNALDLPALPARAEVTLINTVPSAMEELLATDELAAALPAALRAVVLAGEPLLSRLVAKIHEHRPDVRVLDLYGPSETTTYSTGGEIRRGEPGEPTIGRPIAGERAYLLDAHLLPTPGGVAGEIALAGSGLARGYLGRPRQTAERFVPDPFAAAPGGRLYRTGDLGRHRDDGRIEFLGRRDHQVKLHGFRIELGEIEAVLASYPGVREAAVMIDTAMVDGSDGDRRDGDRRLVAYVAGDAELAALRRHLGARLPGYMVPRLFVELEALPRNANGKIDRSALPAAEGRVQNLRNEYVAPDDAIEATIAAVWQELLGLERVGANDNFFDLGGSSLLILRMQRKLNASLGRDLPVVDLLRYPTVRTLAASLGGSTAPTPAAQGQERGEERRAAGELRLAQRDLRRAARGR